jgi:hypothetical protein
MASVNPHQRQQEEPNIRLADAMDEFTPREIGQMNLMTGLIGDSCQGRQNQ